MTADLLPHVAALWVCSRHRQGSGRGRLVEAATVLGWHAALNQLALLYPDRLAGHIN